MWITKKKFNVLEKRITDLEKRSQGQCNVEISPIIQNANCNPNDLVEKHDKKRSLRGFV